MNRIVVSSFASFIMASALVGAQATTPPPTTPAIPGSSTRTDPAVPQDPGTAAVVISDQNKDKETMLTGCLVQGSGPTVFLLENAKTASQGSSETGKTYIVAKAATADEVDLSKNLNHKVSISGSAEDLTVISVPSAVTVQTDKDPVTGDAKVTVGTQGGVNKTDEKMLPKLSARTLISIGDTCTAP
jgi:hypothetical protein